jgi:hypothetical protein
MEVKDNAILIDYEKSIGNNTVYFTSGYIIGDNVLYKFMPKTLPVNCTENDEIIDYYLDLNTKLIKNDNCNDYHLGSIRASLDCECKIQGIYYPLIECRDYMRAFSSAFSIDFNKIAEIIDTCDTETQFDSGFDCGFDVDTEECGLPVTYEDDGTAYNDTPIIYTPENNEKD